MYPRKAALIAGFLGIVLGAAFLFFFVSLSTLSNQVVQYSIRPVPSNVAVSPTYNSSQSGADSYAAQPAIAAAPSYALKGLGILGILGGASLGIAVVTTVLVSKRVNGNGEKKEELD